MASPQSERAASDQKPAESTPVKETSKSGTNGQAEPAEKSDDKPEKPEESPAVNGDSKGDEPRTSDDANVSVPKDKDTEIDAPAKELVEGSAKGSPKDADKSSEQPKSVDPEVQTKDPKAPSNKSASPAPAESSKDVDMSDAPEEKSEKKDDKTDDKSDDKSDEKSTEKTAEASEPAKSATEPQDVEMTQDEEKVNGTNKGVSSPLTSAAPSQEVDLQPASLSQLAIDSDKDKSSKPSDTDVPMTEAPAPASKISREREDDVDAEPAPKRAKTDSNDGASTGGAESTVEVKPQGAQDDLSKGESALDDLPLWNDPERDPKPLTSHQTREFRKVLAGVKKTKHGAHFKDPVVKLWPSLADSYVMRVNNPMDIGELERNLRDSKYSTLRQFKDDLGKIYKNSVIFNGVNNEITFAALNVVTLAWTRVCDIPSAEPAKSKPVPKPSRHSESRTSAPPPPVRRQPSITAASPPAKAEAEAYAVPPGGVPQVRRASTQNDLDRPKRAIQPTKNRDPDYSAKNFNRKKLPIELQFAYEVLGELMDAKNSHCNFPFLNPVDPVALAIPTYFTIIKRPMDLGTIMGKLKNYDYQNIKEFQTDIKQVFKNCYKFNQPGQPVYEQGQQLEVIFRSLWSKKEQWITKHTPAKPVSDVSSRESEDEAEEEEEEAPATTVDNATNKTIQMLEKRLEEETKNLAQLYKTADIAGDTMIDLSQSLISTIRSRILQEKQNLVVAQKPAKTAKAKPPKPTKQKASSAPSKKAAAAPGPKKGGGSVSKKSKQRSMTQPEKDAIANAINDLESPHIERAIDIIKKDTGQSENSSGELELEIDQLTNEALHKLWDLCKKALPTFANGLAPAPAREASPVNTPPSKSAGKSTKPKKNKPMNAQEQEARIAELERLRNMYDGNPQGDQERPGSSGRANEAPIHDHDSESSDDSEEE
ncbi:Bromodomain-containing factor 1 [Colletotrichum shisoi]|uniref:Bromodomain-containing factor 1 n=1 Tax=Colletotrichum shisoi TaxID=2078593 RepID=A0A5Q4BI25_9PEZI|nr:Bromodomain-containing factor 1 [Colletotrichum shisoi]